MTRRVFEDLPNSLSHIFIGILGAFIPGITLAFVFYQLYQFSRGDENLVTDLLEYFLGYGLIYLLKLN
jgi:hypothetical protein